MNTDHCADVGKMVHAEESEPHVSIYVCRDGNSIQVILDTSAEGGDIGLLRCRGTGRVVGADLPMLRDRVGVGGLDGDLDVVNWMTSEPKCVHPEGREQ